MKLLLITSTYPNPSRPYQGIFNQQLVKALQAMHDVRVIAPIAWTDRLIQRQTQSESRSPHPNVYHPTFYYPPRIFRWTYDKWYWLSIQSAYRELMTTYRPNVVLGYWAHPDSAAAVHAARLLDIPSVVMVGGTDICVLAKSGLRRRAIVSVLMRADRVIAFSHDLAGRVAALGVSKDRIEVVDRGVDRSIFHIASRDQARQKLELEKDCLLIVWVGRLVDVKNPEMALRCAVHWKELFSERFRLVIIGEGPLRSRLEKSVAHMGLQACCWFLGAIPQRSVATWLQAANLTILTSRSEGIPNVLRESIACGTDFVATDVGGVREIADPMADKLVPAEDEIAFQRAVVDKLSVTIRPKRPTSNYDLHSLAGRVSEILGQL